MAFLGKRGEEGEPGAAAAVSELDPSTAAHCAPGHQVCRAPGSSPVSGSVACRRLWAAWTLAAGVSGGLGDATWC